MSIDHAKIIKTAAGASAAAAIAYSLGLESETSAGIICLLTIQDTKKETLSITVKRAAAFCIVTALCRVIFGLTGFGFPQFGAVIGIFLAICGLFGINEAAASNCVVATHYLTSMDVSPEMMKNELLLFVIGAGTGVALNVFFMPVNIGRIRVIQRETDERIRDILRGMSDYIMTEDRSGYTDERLEEAEKLLEKLRKEALRYIGNSFSGEKDYFYKYVKLRMAQCSLLTRISSDIRRLDGVSDYGEPVAGFLSSTAERFAEVNDAVALSKEAEGLFARYSAMALPADRQEFESRALLYHILCDIRQFIALKKDFAAKLSKSEKDVFWRPR